MSATLAFDVYGTLIDTHGVVEVLQGYIGDDANGFSQTWRDKQLEYSFRRGLMKKYENFTICTSNALDYTCLYYNTDLTPEQKNKLLETYRVLPAFPDVEKGLKKLHTSNHRLYAFSNGKDEAVENLLINAGIRDSFLGIVSVDKIKSFKPDPEVYELFLKQSGAENNNAWLISSNPFDVIGAISAGMKAAWVQRTETAIFDPWGIEPTTTISSLSDLCENLEQY